MARELSFMEHLGDLRRRVLICALAIVVGDRCFLLFFDEIIEFLCALQAWKRAKTVS